MRTLRLFLSGLSIGLAAGYTAPASPLPNKEAGGLTSDLAVRYPHTMQFEVAMRYANGEGVPKDRAKAARLYLEAAQLGDARAQNNLAFMYANGDGMPTNLILAHIWWKRAGSRGLEDARKNLVALEKFMSADELAKAVQLEQATPDMGEKTAIIGGSGSSDLGKEYEMFDVSLLDQIPVAKFQPPPTYPFEMRRAGISGEVVVDFIITPAGEVWNAYAIRFTRPEFAAPAVTAVSKWKFRPGKKGGRAVYTHMQVPIGFTLSDF